MWRRLIIALSGLILVAVACADMGELDYGPLELVVVNKGTTVGRPLEELTIHAAADDHVAAPNRLTAPLELDESASFTDVPSGQWYVTVVRAQRALPGSPKMALTTASPLALYGGRRELWVFDESFRLLDPTNNLDGQSDNNTDSR